jgi:hypothetical protein
VTARTFQTEQLSDVSRCMPPANVCARMPRGRSHAYDRWARFASGTRHSGLAPLLRAPGGCGRSVLHSCARWFRGACLPVCIACMRTRADSHSVPTGDIPQRHGIPQRHSSPQRHGIPHTRLREHALLARPQRRHVREGRVEPAELARRRREQRVLLPPVRVPARRGVAWHVACDVACDMAGRREQRVLLLWWRVRLRRARVRARVVAAGGGRVLGPEGRREYCQKLGCLKRSGYLGSGGMY